MKVYIVETDCYENQGVSGVYATAELAMAAHPVPADYQYPEVRSASNASRRGGWQQNEHGEWDNGLDWDHSARVTAWDVVGDGKELEQVENQTL